MRALAPALLLAGFALRLWQLGAESLWYDETVSVALAQLPAAQMVARTAGDIHPPGYYLLLHLWQLVSAPTPAATGTGATQPLEFLYAYVSVAASLLVLALLVPLGRRLVGAPAAGIALALAAVGPFHIWYAQEVRMYAVAGALGLLCLWATLRWMETGRRRWLAVYVVAAAAGLWTLYYFLFLLAGVATAALILAPSRRRLGGWLLAQFGVLLLFAPWLPVLWRQATNPPVPPWRTPWNDAGAFFASLNEALAAPLLGHVQLGPTVLWSLLAVALTALFLWRAGKEERRRRWALVAVVWGPTLLLLLISLLGPPLYHARYLYPWTAPFALVVGGALAPRAQASAPRWRSRLGWAAAGALAVASLFALRAFWSDPAYAADNHRGAVHSLAAAWRPGDAVLVNAGWVWPPLAVYWPTAQDGRSFAPGAPPPLAAAQRVGATPAEPFAPAGAAAVPLLRTGSIDGSASLGWGDPASDFFATTSAATTADLERAAATYSRLWHYRFYDTVNDPGGVIRAWLAAAGELVRDEAIPGRDFGRLQLFDLGRDGAGVAGAGTGDAWLAQEGGAAVLRVLAAGATAPAAGKLLYATVVLEPQPALAELGVGLSSSLRLYDATGAQLAQADESPQPPSTSWPPGQPVTLRLAVAAPNPLPPGSLSVELILYRQDTAAPLPVAGPSAVEGTRFRISD